MTNAANEAAAKKAAVLDQLASKQADDDFLWLMNQRSGRRFVWDLLGRCNVFATSFNTHGGLMTLAEGKKQIGYQYLNKINQLCPDLYVVMMNEANEAACNRELQLEQTEETND
ncbi:Bbp19 family protein [Stutzerimonas chloritidismutans]